MSVLPKLYLFREVQIFKFFSTWNKGDVHDERCPYHVDNTGKVGRKKLSAYYESI